MMRMSDGKVGLVEAGSILFIMLSAKIADTTMAYFLHEGQTAAALINLLSGVLITLSFLFLLSVLKKNESRSLMEINTRYLGKILGFFLNFVLFLIILFASVYHGKLNSEMFSLIFLEHTPTEFIWIMGMLSAVFISLRGFETIGRIAWIMAPIFIFIFVMLIVFVMVSDTETNWRYNLPLFGPGIERVLKLSVENSGHYGEVILFAAFFPFVRKYQDFKKSTLVVLIYSILATSLFLALSISIYNFPSIGCTAFPFVTVAKTINIGRFIYNVESGFLFVVILGQLIRFAAYLYLTTFIFAQTFKIKEHEPMLIPFAFLIFLIGQLVHGLLGAMAFRAAALKYIWIIFLFYPILLWGVAKWKERGIS